jgi:hypothetical protein
MLRGLSSSFLILHAPTPQSAFNTLKQSVGRRRVSALQLFLATRLLLSFNPHPYDHAPISTPLIMGISSAVCYNLT